MSINHTKLYDNLINKLYEKEKNIYFLEIGAFDGITSDPLYHHVKSKNMKGILLEPIKYYYDKLINNYKKINYYDKLIFENIAISENKGFKYINWVNPDVIKNKKLPKWYSGHSSFLDDHTPGIGGWGHNNVSNKLKVETLTLKDLINKNKVDKIDIYQSDTEGYDIRILKQLDFTKFNPYIINIESNKLTDDEIIYCKDLFEKNNYSYINFYKPSSNKLKNSNNTSSKLYVKNSLNLSDDKIKDGIDWIAWKNLDINI